MNNILLHPALNRKNLQLMAERAELTPIISIAKGHYGEFQTCKVVIQPIFDSRVSGRSYWRVCVDGVVFHYPQTLKIADAVTLAFAALNGDMA